MAAGAMLTVIDETLVYFIFDYDGIVEEVE
jgi:hypothetical protein